MKNENLLGLDIAQFKNETTHQLTTFDLEKKNKTIDLPRGKRVTLGEVKGSGYITQIWFTFPGWFWPHWRPDAPISQTILKTLILRIYWDGEKKAAVQAPISDFCGNGLGEISNFTSKYFGMSSGGFFCKFPMPFRKGFRIELENVDKQIDTYVFSNVLYQLTSEPVKDAGYFHADFHTGRNPGPEPIDILDAKGTGHLAGCVLSAQGVERNYLSFLEAPEYIYIDEDWKKPRIVGTGLEDYFLGGWYFREGEFIGELHGVPSKDILNSSVAMYRTHETDAVHFKKRIRFQFVNPWEPGRLKPFVWSSVAFYYLDSPAGSDLKIPSYKELVCFRMRNTDHLSVP